MIVVIHELASGRIRRIVTCAPADAALQPVPDGHAALVLPPDHAPIDDRRHRVEVGVTGAGVIVEGPHTGSKAEALAASRATKPNTP